MILDKFDMVYNLGNLFMSYVIYKFIHIFYSECKVNAMVERLGYLGYFLLITCTHMFVNITIIVMLVYILLLFGLVSLYRGDLKKAVLSVTIVYGTFMCIEALVVFLTGFLTLNIFVPFQYSSEFGVVCVHMISFVFVLLMNGFGHVKNEYPLPFIYWISLIMIPSGTIVLLFVIFTGNTTSKALIFISIFIAFAINIAAFYLYDRICCFMILQINKRVTEEQNRYYEYQIEIVKDSLENIRMFRHDMKNRLSPLYELARNDKKEELMEELSRLTDICCCGKKYAASGNEVIDSMINFKFQQTERENIKISIETAIPTVLSISTFDLAVIVGNLIDNAMEAVAAVKEDRWIDIKIKYAKGRLIFQISNSYDGFVKLKNHLLITRKENNKNHGFGIKSVQSAIQKYDGAMQITYDEKCFKVKVMVYVQL